jgi:hypothetical protein
MDVPFTMQCLTYVFVQAVITLILFKALSEIVKALRSTWSTSSQSMVTSILSEPTAFIPVSLPVGTDSTTVVPPKAVDGKGSFSRTAGFIGAIGMSSVFIGIGYWVTYALFFHPDQLGYLKSTAYYFGAGSALFFPYAFNQISRLLKA